MGDDINVIGYTDAVVLVMEKEVAATHAGIEEDANMLYPKG